MSWAAVSLADKLDTLVGLHHVGERATGSRDPFGLRRHANGVFRILVDLPKLTGLTVRPTVVSLLEAAEEQFGSSTEPGSLKLSEHYAFLAERLRYVLEQRHFDIRNVRAVTHPLIEKLSPVDALRKLEALPEVTKSPEFRQLAIVFKRVKNIAGSTGKVGDKDLNVQPPDDQMSDTGSFSLLREPAEVALLKEIETRKPVIEKVVKSGEDYRRGFAEAAKFGPAVDRFFTEVFVMVDDQKLRTARLHLMKRLERLILQLADVSEIVPAAE